MTKPKPKHRHLSRLPQFLIIGGVVLLSTILLTLKLDKTPTAASPTLTRDLPEVQLERALQAGQPTLAFFHSTTCAKCIQMMGIVGQVRPEFSDSITLVDVDVYDDRNTQLIQQARVQYIPTLIFYDRSGKEQVHVGVMEAEQLRQTLAALAGSE